MYVCMYVSGSQTIFVNDFSERAETISILETAFDAYSRNLDLISF